MSPRASDDAIPEPIPAPATSPQLRRVPAGTPLATPIVRLRVAEGTAPVAQIAPPRIGVRAVLAALVVLAIGLVAAYALYARAARGEAFEQHYPIVAEGSDAQTIEREAARWSTGAPRLVRALSAFRAPPLDSLVGAGACAFAGDGLRFTAGPDLAALVRAAIDDLLVVAGRGRFVSAAAEAELVQQLTGPVLVVAGGVSYAFDPGTGALACAGTQGLRAVE